MVTIRSQIISSNLIELPRLSTTKRETTNLDSLKYKSTPHGQAQKECFCTDLII